MTFADCLADLCFALDNCEIPYLIGGSVASTYWSKPRTTQDIDMSVRIRPGSGPELQHYLPNGYTVFPRDWDDLLLANDEYPCAEVSHESAPFRADLFIVRPTEFVNGQFARAVRSELFPGLTVPLITAEDCVVQKLRWYELGHRVSDKQWNDIVGILEVQAGRLDLEYLDRWTRHFGVHDLLLEAIDQADMT